MSGHFSNRHFSDLPEASFMSTYDTFLSQSPFWFLMEWFCLATEEWKRDYQVDRIRTCCEVARNPTLDSANGTCGFIKDPPSP